MAEQRKLRKVGDSYVMAVPRAVRAHLGVKHEGLLYWHLVGPREAVLTPHPVRVGGKPLGLHLTADLAGARKRIEELEGKLRGRILSERHEVENAVYLQALRFFNPTAARVEETYRLVQEIRERLVQRRRGGPRGPATASGPPSEPGPVSEEKNEAPDVPVASAEAARDLIQGSTSPATAEN
ncbi:MAG: hypothetical protein Q8Q14_02930 [Gemmatimonadales bacterium]|nr:hypothetical protein [Gemmatimonadales bacterium]